MKIQVLDHGYVEFIEAYGTGKSGVGELDLALDPNVAGEIEIPYHYECGIIEAARQSTQGSFRGWETDQRLLTYLYEHKHSTPFEFAGMIIEVQAPIFVLREWHRHRTQSYNEMSARYTPLPDLYYTPDYDVVMERASRSEANKQASGSGFKDPEDVGFWIDALSEGYDTCEKIYKTALEKGIPKELARLIMPVGHYSKMRASASLRNWIAFLTLRMDPNAQWEIRQYAGAVHEIITNFFPRTAELFNREFSIIKEN